MVTVSEDRPSTPDPTGSSDFPLFISTPVNDPSTPTVDVPDATLDPSPPTVDVPDATLDPSPPTVDVPDVTLDPSPPTVDVPDATLDSLPTIVTTGNQLAISHPPFRKHTGSLLDLDGSDHPYHFFEAIFGNDTFDLIVAQTFPECDIVICLFEAVWPCFP